MAITDSPTEKDGPYFNALLAVAAIINQTGTCGKTELEACLASAGIEDFKDYVEILLEEDADEDGLGEEDEAGSNPADPAEANTEDFDEIEEALGDAQLGKEIHGEDEESE